MCVYRYMGKSVLNAVKNLNTEISEALIGKDPREQKAIDDVAPRVAKLRKAREEARAAG